MFLYKNKNIEKLYLFRDQLPEIDKEDFILKVLAKSKKIKKLIKKFYLISDQIMEDKSYYLIFSDDCQSIASPTLPINNENEEITDSSITRAFY
jgi:hypothetical protein